MRMCKVFSGLLALLLAVALLVVPAMASPDDNGAAEQEPLVEITEPEPGDEATEPGTETVEPEPGTGGAEALTPEGNMTLVDNIGSGDKQFIVVQSRNGYYFYIIIDHAIEGENTVHFLNQVDEADLLALIEGEVSAPPVPVCTCTAKCTVGAVNTFCEVCAVSMSECIGMEPEMKPGTEPGPETTGQPDTPAGPDAPKEPAETGGVDPLVILVVLAALGTGGAAVCKMIFSKKKSSAKRNADLDDYDCGDDDTDDSDEPEDDEPEDDDPDEETEDE